jgi:hypothetical protein
MYSLLSTAELESRKLSRFYSLNMWLVNLYEVFIYDDFRSNVGTYKHMNNISLQNVTGFDQNLFYILTNG